jgi:hypothetical protein
MKRLGAFAAACVLAGCAVPGEAPRAIAAAPTASPAPAPAPAAAPPALEVRNPGFEDDMMRGRRCAPGWDCTMHGNPEAFRFSLQEGGAAAGRYAFCVVRVADEPWALVTQAFQAPPPRGLRLRLSMAVRVEGASGGGAGPWILAQGRPPTSASKLVRGTRGWERVAVEFSVPADASVVEVGASVEGPGKACFDDVRLEIVPPA